MTVTENCALIIFVRNPELGKVKTRLAKTTGDEQALHIYKQLLQRTADISQDLTYSKFVFYADEVNYEDIWNNGHYFKRKQNGSDLGERMYNAFNQLFAEGFRKVVIIGSDCYDLSTGILNSGFNKLEEYDSVVGPSTDGGYYLLGTNKLIPEIFENKQWSTETVLTSTINDFKMLGYNYFLLPVLTDVDEEENIPAELLQKFV